MSQYDSERLTQEFTLIEPDKLSDLRIKFFTSDEMKIAIDYYEGFVDKPTRTRIITAKYFRPG